MYPRLFSLLFAIGLLLCSCNDDEVTDNATSSKTTIVYMMAENSMSEYCQSDIGEMVAASGKINSNDHLIIYIDKAVLYGDPRPMLLQVRDNRLDTLKIYPEQDSCDGDVFVSVLQDATQQAKAESYSLVMWSHGSGWLPSRQKKTIGIDNNKNTLSNDGTEMEIATMRESIESTGIHFDWIFFDACFMQCIETAYELKDLTDYVVGSPAEVPGMGAPYNSIVPDFFCRDKEHSALAIAQHYYDYYKDGKGMLISVIKTSELDNLANATAQCFDEMPTVDDAEGIQQFGPWTKLAYWHSEYYDMASLMYHKVDAARFLQWRGQMEAAVPLQLYTNRWTSEFNSCFNPVITDRYHYSGVSMFLTAERYEEHGLNTAITSTRWWKAITRG